MPIWIPDWNSSDIKDLVGGVKLDTTPSDILKEHKEFVSDKNTYLS